MRALRRPGVLGAVLAVVVTVVPATPAAAGVAISGSATMPTAVAVGQTGLAGSITFSNNNTAPNLEPNIVTQIRLAPSCGTTGTAANLCPQPDPGVFSISSTAVGRAGTACAGRTFTVSAPDATGTVVFTPTGGSLLVPISNGSPGSNTCSIDFTFSVLKVPTIDAEPPTAGPQTRANFLITMQGSVTTAAVVNSLPTLPITVLKATPTVVTQASRNVGAGTISDTATVSGPPGLPTPTGTVVFSAYGPNNATCAGPAVFVSTVPLSGGTAVSSNFPVPAAGTYRFVATYSGDANYVPVTAPCNAPNESVVGVLRDAVGDFDGDRDTDVAVYRPPSGLWYVQSPFSAVAWGLPGDIPVPGDYDGNGTTEHAVFRPSNNTWYLRGPNPTSTVWGAAGDIPVPADYDGDGDTDVAVFRPSNGLWYVQTPFSVVAWGQSGDVPVPGDYDNNGTAEPAVYRPSNGTWYLRSTTPTAAVWGVAGDIPVPGDYDGNGSTDIAVFRPNGGLWYVRTPFSVISGWGQPGDVPVPGDYNGDGIFEPAVYRPSNATWYLRTPAPIVTVWGAAGDIPTPLPHAIYRAYF